MINFSVCGKCGGFECTTKVPCKPLPDVMADAGFPRANFLSLDVEGGEARVMGTVLEGVGNSSENFTIGVVLTSDPFIGFRRTKNSS